MIEIAIEHLSPSTLQQFKKCGKKLYYRKILGLPDNTSYATTNYGSAFHKAAELLFESKRFGYNMKLEEFIKTFKEEYSKLAEQTTIWKEDSKEHLLEQGELACKDFYEMFLDKYKPLHIEKEYVIERKDKLPIKCYPDLITEDHIILDYKFGRGFGGSASEGDYITNMTTYAYGHWKETRVVPRVIIIKQKWSKKKQPNGKYKFFHNTFEEVEMPVKKEWFKYVLSNYDDLEHAIKNDVWLKAQDNNGLCRECAYRQNCGVILL